jgi:4-amino-4-deoxy-L-arabinose transferase-like glycosyltransferase
LLLIVLLALALRVFHLDTQSIWYDEGLSIQLAEQSPVEVIALSAITDHPPLHTLLLGAWLRVTGDSDFVVRYLSVFCGVLVVALTYALGKRFDERAGLIGAGLIAIAPLAVYYSQEARGYMLLTALILIATLAALRLLNGDRRTRVWFAYSAAMALALYTHYFAAFAWAAINVGWVVIRLGRAVARRRPNAVSTSLRGALSSDEAVLQAGGESASHPSTAPQKDAAPLRMLAVTLSHKSSLSRDFVAWLFAQLIILACFLPWLPSALAQAGSNATYFPGRVTWDTVFGDTWRAFSVGEWGDMSLVGWLWLAVIVFGVMAGLAIYRDRRRRSTMVVALVVVIIPLLLMSGLAWFKPKFAPRYLLPSLPAFITLAAIGITILIDGTRTRYCRWASIGVAITLALPLASIGSLMQLYSDPAVARPNVRSVVRYIAAHDQPSDAILLVGGHQAPAFDHYYRGAATVIPLPPDLLPAAQSPLDARALGQLRSIGLAHPRVWLVKWQSEISDPTNLIEDTLIATSRRLDVGANFHGMSVLLFDVSEAQIADAPQYPLAEVFAEPIRAVGYNVDSRRISIDTPLRFGLYLTAEGAVSGNYQIFTHLVDAQGNLIAQADHIAGADSFPTSLWKPGSLLYNRFEIAVPPGTRPGEYQVLIGLYDQRGRLALADGRDHLKLFDVTLTP